MVPAYYLSSWGLRRRIGSGEFPPGSPLPSLTSIAEQYQVGRTTARKAVGTLRDEQIVETVQGWGTFVADSGTLRLP